MTALYRILPPQATPLERAIVEGAPNWDALAGAISGVDGNPPDAFKPWAAGELGLAQFAEYFESIDALLEAGRPWIFERGTAAGIRRVLGWLGYDDIQIEEDGWFLHINLGRIADAQAIEHIRRVVLATLPAHMRFYRVFFGYDLRPVRLDRGPALDLGLLDNDSGVWVGDVKASFGVGRSAVVPAAPRLGTRQAHTHVRTLKINYDDRALLDVWRLDSQIMVDAFGGIGELFTGRCNAPQVGTPTRTDSEIRTGLAAWAASAPASGGRETFTGTTPVPVLARRRWRGAWLGPWRPFIPLTSTEET